MTQLNNKENWADKLENAVEKDVQNDEIRVELISGTSKAGKFTKHFKSPLVSMKCVYFLQNLN